MSVRLVCVPVSCFASPYLPVRYQHRQPSDVIFLFSQHQQNANGSYAQSSGIYPQHSAEPKRPSYGDANSKSRRLTTIQIWLRKKAEPARRSSWGCVQSASHGRAYCLTRLLTDAILSVVPHIQNFSSATVHLDRVPPCTTQWDLQRRPCLYMFPYRQNVSLRVAHSHLDAPAHNTLFTIADKHSRQADPVCCLVSRANGRHDGSRS